MREIAKLGHIVVETPNIDQSLQFYQETIGLIVTARERNTVYLRAQNDWEHHSLLLKESNSAKIDHIGWRISDQRDLTRFAEHLEASSVTVKWIEENMEMGIGEAIRFEVPTGHIFELYYEVEKPEVPSEEQSKLKTRPYATDGRLRPRRIDHVTVEDTEPETYFTWLEDHLGFQLNEYIESEEGKLGLWGSVTSQNHDTGAVLNRSHSKNSNPAVHHVAYRVDRLGQLYDYAEILREEGYPMIGPGKHGISQAEYLYTVDPGSGLRTELYTGGYHIFEPDWEAKRYSENEFDLAMSITPQGKIKAQEFGSMSYKPMETNNQEE